MASSQRIVYVVGLLIGLAIFLLARNWFMVLLRELGYVEGVPGSLLVSALFLACMFVMCAGYGVGIAFWVRRRMGRSGR